MASKWRKFATVFKFAAGLFLTSLVEKGHVKIKPSEKALIEETVSIIEKIEEKVDGKDVPDQ